MPKKNPVTVALPQTTPSVDLPPGLAETLNLIIDSGPDGISSVDLMDNCKESLSAVKNISSLRSLGAQITTERRNVVHRERKRTGVAHYTYRGWL